MFQKLLRRITACRTVPTCRSLMLLAGIAFVLQLQAFAQVPTYTGCYSATSGTINKLALGFSPQKVCNTGDIAVSFSAGDITKISVSGGLTGGGDNGDLTISLDPKYSLPQSCPENYIAKWSGAAWMCAADENTTYTNGTGISLSSSNVFSLGSGYQLPQNCSDGAIAKTSGGTWNCALESAGPEIWVTYGGYTPIAVNAIQPVAKLNLPGGNTYMIHANVQVGATNADFIEVACQLYRNGTDEVMTGTGNLFRAIESSANPLWKIGTGSVALNAVIQLNAPGTIDLKCFGVEDQADQWASNAALIAVKAGTVHVQ